MLRYDGTLMLAVLVIASQMGEMVEGNEFGGPRINGLQEDGNVPFWFTPAGMAVRYAIVAVLFGSLLLFFIIAYTHAQRRIRQGKPPLLYHRWMIRSPPYQPGILQPHPQSRHAYHRDPTYQGYTMESYPPPPPAYNPTELSPPIYQPPQGGSKAMADQNFSAVYTHRAGESSVQVLPYAGARDL